jgi:hypothetical protein
VGTIGITNSRQHSFTLSLDGGREVAHPSGWCHARHNPHCFTRQHLYPSGILAMSETLNT